MWDYFGQQAEIAQQLKIKPEDKIEKPEALRRYEQAISLGIPYVDGGLQDQPYIWMQEHGVITRYYEERDIVKANLDAQFNASNNNSSPRRGARLIR